MILIAAVTVVFAGPGAPPEALADALMAEEAVTTVRIGDHGARSVLRADVRDEAEAAAIAERVAARLGLEAAVLSVTLVSDAGRPLIPGNNSTDADPQ